MAERPGSSKLLLLACLSLFGFWGYISFSPYPSTVSHSLLKTKSELWDHVDHGFVVLESDRASVSSHLWAASEFENKRFGVSPIDATYWLGDWLIRLSMSHVSHLQSQGCDGPRSERCDWNEATINPTTRQFSGSSWLVGSVGLQASPILWLRINVTFSVLILITLL